MYSLRTACALTAALRPPLFSHSLLLSPVLLCLRVHHVASSFHASRSSFDTLARVSSSLVCSASLMHISISELRVASSSFHQPCRAPAHVRLWRGCFYSPASSFHAAHHDLLTLMTDRIVSLQSVAAAALLALCCMRASHLPRRSLLCSLYACIRLREDACHGRGRFARTLWDEQNAPLRSLSL